MAGDAEAMKELNPNHPVTIQARQHWHKIAVLIMLKLGVKEVQITKKDVEELLVKGDVNIVLDARNEIQTGYFTVRIVDDKTAAKLAKTEGGRAEDS
jgi:hypothetical protein